MEALNYGKWNAVGRSKGLLRLLLRRGHTVSTTIRPPSSSRSSRRRRGNQDWMVNFITNTPSTFSCGTVSGLGRQAGRRLILLISESYSTVSSSLGIPPPDPSLVLVNLLICFWSSVSSILPTHNRYFDSVLWVMLWRWSFPNFILPSLPRLCPIPAYTPGYNT